MEEYENSEEFENQQVYLPEESNKELEVDRKAYSFLEFITLEWPSQTITGNETTVYVAPNTDNTTQPFICSLTFEDLHSLQNFSVKRKNVDFNINRMTSGENILAVSDEMMYLLDFDLNILHSYKDMFSYGCFITQNNEYIISKPNGNISLLSKEAKEFLTFKAHESDVNSITMFNNNIFSCSNDKNLSIFDYRSNKFIKKLNFTEELNSLDVLENKVVIGDDTGKIRIIDLRNYEEEVVDWHKTPISYIRTIDDTSFLSSSSQQICIWDTSFEDEWEYNKYLQFVHQGQSEYKEVIEIEPNYYVSTSAGGLCFFSPIELDA